ncbi:hypothetical protein GCM10007874_39880 [Labrys miyagiensis]|uniref:Uncharacterized protein n=1 Tax=Labrys miyagiensis TaxID=346912 RepID=A0ABQ6CKZ6_9HYPH|nr:hypothetical protein GCM10007874_39880 [Labrys miyagiensis]
MPLPYRITAHTVKVPVTMPSGLLICKTSSETLPTPDGLGSRGARLDEFHPHRPAFARRKPPWSGYWARARDGTP